MRSSSRTCYAFFIHPTFPSSPEIRVARKMTFTQGVVCSVLMGWQSGVVNWNIRRNLSAAACMDYTSPVTARIV